MNGPNNAIGWCDYTWNPVTGCRHGCTFGPKKTPCYAAVIARRLHGTAAFPQGFEPAFHHGRLNQPAKVKVGARVFVCSMADLWGAWVPDAWIEAVLGACRAATQHTFLTVTKAPARILDWADSWPPTLWAGEARKEGVNSQSRLW